MTFITDLNLDRMVRSATAGSAGEPYCALIVGNLWGCEGWKAMSMDDIDAFWVDAKSSGLTVREFIAAKREELA